MTSLEKRAKKQWKNNHFSNIVSKYPPLDMTRFLTRNAEITHKIPTYTDEQKEFLIDSHLKYLYNKIYKDLSDLYYKIRQDSYHGKAFTIHIIEWAESKLPIEEDNELKKIYINTLRKALRKSNYKCSIKNLSLESPDIFIVRIAWCKTVEEHIKNKTLKKGTKVLYPPTGAYGEVMFIRYTNLQTPGWEKISIKWNGTDIKVNYEDFKYLYVIEEENDRVYTEKELDKNALDEEENNNDDNNKV